MRASVLEGDGITIFIPPFRAPIDCIAERFQHAQLDGFERKAGERNPAPIVVVSADMIERGDFMTWFRTLAQHGLLRHIFVDECHTTFTDSHRRERLGAVREPASYYPPSTHGPRHYCLTEWVRLSTVWVPPPLG